MAKATAQDADLILKIYELRREKTLNDARAWFANKFEADTLDQMRKRYPPGSKEDEYFRLVVSYWDMVGALIYYQTVNEDLFFDTNREFLAVWRKAQAIIEELRQTRTNPKLYENIEYLVRTYNLWADRQQPKQLP